MLHARTWAEIDLDAMAHNLGIVQAAVGTGVAIMPVVKADAYGHGAVPTAWHLLHHGVAMLGVGDSTEALKLRAAGITAPILVLGAVVPGELNDVLRGQIDLTVHSEDRVCALREEVRRSGFGVRVHLKIDTGMGRLGCHPARATEIAQEIERSPGVVLAGVATHLAQTEPAGGAIATQQLARFDDAVSELAAHDIRPRWLHAHASGSVLSELPGPFNLVRPGLALYGVDPHLRADTPLRSVLSWRTQIVFLKDHAPGASIGYGGTWTAERKSRIATLPLGYNDGYRFSFSNRAHVLVRGQRCPVVGRVSMDYVSIDVTDVPDASVNDVVTLVGQDGSESITIAALAAWADTITHDILCGLGRRVRRQYIGGRPIEDPPA